MGAAKRRGNYQERVRQAEARAAAAAEAKHAADQALADVRAIEPGDPRVDERIVRALDRRGKAAMLAGVASLGRGK